MNDDNYKKEINKASTIDFEQFLLDFNEATGKIKRVLDAKTKRQIKERLKDGYTLQDILKAAKNCSKDDYHIKNPKFLTPEFITRPDKMQKYIDADIEGNKIINDDNEIREQNYSKYKPKIFTGRN